MCLILQAFTGLCRSFPQFQWETEAMGNLRSFLLSIPCPLAGMAWYGSASLLLHCPACCIPSPRWCPSTYATMPTPGLWRHGEHTTIAERTI